MDLKVNLTLTRQQAKQTRLAVCAHFKDPEGLVEAVVTLMNYIRMGGMASLLLLVFDLPENFQQAVKKAEATIHEVADQNEVGVTVGSINPDNTEMVRITVWLKKKKE